MRTRGRLGGSALLLALVVAGCGLAAPQTTARTADRVVRVVASLPHAAAGLGHSGHHALVGARAHSPATSAASLRPVAAAAMVLVLLAVAAAAVTRSGRRVRRTAGIRAPPAMSVTTSS